MKTKLGNPKDMIDCAPTWKSIFPLMAKWINEGNEEQREYVISELEKLCRIADSYIEKKKVNQ